MTITVGIADLFIFAPAHQSGFLFSAHLFPSAQIVNLYLLFTCNKSYNSGCSKKGRLLTHETKKESLAMSEIQTGDRVRIL